jgi:hypothetical protein
MDRGDTGRILEEVASFGVEIKPRLTRRHTADGHGGTLVTGRTEFCSLYLRIGSPSFRSSNAY